MLSCPSSVSNLINSDKKGEKPQSLDYDWGVILREIKGQNVCSHMIWHICIWFNYCKYITITPLITQFLLWKNKVEWNKEIWIEYAFIWRVVSWVTLRVIFNSKLYFLVETLVSIPWSVVYEWNFDVPNILVSLLALH